MLHLIINTLLTAIFIYLVFCLITTLFNTEPFTSKPTIAEKNDRVDKILKNHELFTTDMYTTRTVMPWMDPLIYEEARKLKLNNNLNEHTTKKLFE